ncbi:MAG: hypothetical protein A2536_09255 [Candidatus Firestonebacteria bacterium RIFOXYD2_FULL_39_29]|nr:MAG: hypothetical protein A2536_09255 [Candidatus Firestonebacteria bacterium RIFOXYD2_FULL_39_29]
MGYGTNEITLDNMEAWECEVSGCNAVRIIPDFIEEGRVKINTPQKKIAVKAVAYIGIGTGININILGGKVGDIGDRRFLPAEEEVGEADHIQTEVTGRKGFER